MTISKNIIKYFDEYIKNYTPYKDNKFYTAIIEHIKNSLVDFIYNKNPIQLKSLYENNLIPIDVTHTLLIQLGVPEQILNKLSISDQIIFLQSLSNFFRYKGSIDFFKKTSKIFSDDFEIYELYIDFYPPTNKWVLKPVAILGDPDFHDVISYIDIYNSIPSTLVSEDQLTKYKTDCDIVLPLKSNLLLLKYHFIQEVNSFLNLIISTFMKQYGTNQFNIYFLNGSFYVSINQFVYIWFYIILRLYDGVWPEYEITKINILLSYFNPYTMDDIDILFDEYNNLENSVDALTFFNENIQLYFNYIYYTSETTVSDMELNINSDILDYLNTRINNINPNFIKSEYHQILNELLNSFSLYSCTQTDNMYIKYYEYFITFLPQIILNPKETKSYFILDNFKPFHTEIITQQNQYIKVQSKFDLVTPKTIYNFAIQLSNIDACLIIDNFNFLIYYPSLNDYFNIIEQIIYQITYMYSSVFNISEKSKLIYNLNYALLLNIIDKIQQIKYNLKDNGSNTLLLTEIISKLKLQLKNQSNLDIVEEITNIVQYDKISLLNIIDDIQVIKYNLKDNGSNTLLLNEVISDLKIQLENQSNLDITEQVINNTYYDKISLLNIIDEIQQIKYNLKDSGENTLLLTEIISKLKLQLEIQSNLNIVEKVVNNIYYDKISLLNIIDKIQQIKYNLKDSGENTLLLTEIISKLKLQLEIQSNLDIVEEITNIVQYDKISLFNMVDILQVIKYNLKDHILILDILSKLKLQLQIQSILNIVEEVTNTIYYNKISLLNIIDNNQVKYNIKDNGNNTLLLTEIISKLNLQLRNQLNLNITEKNINNIQYNKLNMMNLVDDYYIDFNNTESLSIIENFNIEKV